MKKKVTCIIDFGQSHLKFILLTEYLTVTRILVFKNSFKCSKKKRFYYDSKKIYKFLKIQISKINNHYEIHKLSFIAHGSACFYLDKKNLINDGYHFSSNFNQNFFFRKYKPKFSETFTPDLNKLHNLGKNFFLIKNKNEDFKFMTLPSYLGWSFSGNNFIDTSYLGCHTYLWNFKKKKFSSLIKKLNGLKNMPKILKSGKFIGYANNSSFKISKNCKIYNGLHDTSSSFNFHKNFFNYKNSIFLSTGTTFVFGHYINDKFKLKQSEGFYHMCGIKKSNKILCKKFDGGILYKKNQSKIKEKKIAEISVNHINSILKKIKKEKINIIIDGPFSKNKKFISFLKISKNLNIFCSKSEYIPALGAAFLFKKKSVKLYRDNFYFKF